MSDIALFEDTGMPDAGWWEALWPEPGRVMTSIGVQQGTTVVDLCCGDGWFMLPLARLARHAIGIDADTARLATARLRLNEAGVKNVSLLEGDAYEVADLLEEPADLIILANVLHGVSDRPRLARAIAGALKPKGQLAVINWHARPREKTKVLGEPRGPASELRMTPPETIIAIEPAGFTLANFADVSPHHYAAIFERSAGTSPA